MNYAHYSCSTNFLLQVVFIGMFLGSNMWGKWADKYGRLPVGILGSYSNIHIKKKACMLQFIPNVI